MTWRCAFALSTPQAHAGYIYVYIGLLESDLKMSKSQVNAVSFDENVSHLSNLFERNEHFLWAKQLLETKQTSAQLTRSRETKELMWPSRTTNIAWKTCVLTQAVKLAGMETKKYRNGQEVSQSLLVNIPVVTEPSRLRCNKKIKMFKISRVKYKAYYCKALYLVQYTTFVCNKKKNFLSIVFRIYLATRLCRSRPLGKKSQFSLPLYDSWCLYCKNKNTADALLYVYDGYGLDNCYSIKCSKQQEKYCVSRAKIFTSGDIELNPGPVN